MNEILRKIKKDPTSYAVIFVSILIFIIGIFTIGFLKSFIIIIILNLLFQMPNILKYINKIKKNNNKKKYDKPKYDYKEMNSYRNGSTKKINNSNKNKNSIKNKENMMKKKKDNSSSHKNKSIKDKNEFSKDTKKAKNKKRQKILQIILLICFIGALLIIFACIAFFMYIVINSPKFNADALYTSEPSYLYDINGNEIAALGSEQRILLTYDEVPEVLVNAIIATEDSKFFQHNGVDLGRFLKASAKQLIGQNAGGASTLTMQISKNAYTDTTSTGWKGIVRKFTDVYLSVFKIEPTYTKEQIFEFYINSYFLGGGYGVEQTSLTYFGKSAKDLNLSEAAMIAGLFQAPNTYNPYTNPEATEKRRKQVLYLMHRHGYITDKEYDIASKMTVDKIVVPKAEGVSNEVNPDYQSFIDAVVEEVRTKTELDPYTTPMDIYTTMDPDKQKYVADIMNGKTYEWENDVVQAGVAVIDVNNGAVVALGGGRNINAVGTYNYATMIENQIGSTAKPLYDYGPAIEYLNWSTYNIVSDEPISYSDGTKISNWNGSYEGFETMRKALVGSRNIPALKAFKANDKANIISFVTNLGLSPEVVGNNTIYEPHAIGGYNGESPLTMAAAYAAFANGGYYSKPYTFTKIIYRSNGEEYDNVSTRNKVMSDETAYMISDMLVDTGQYALGRFANINGMQYAAKTGTTNYDAQTLAAHGLSNTNAVNDLWTVGYNPDYAIGVWYGYDKISSEYYNRLSSAQHERLFQAVGRGIFTSGKTFTRPSSVVEVTLEYGCPTPCLPSEYTPDNFKTTELFRSGTEPTTVSPRFAKLNDITNLKASEKNGTVTLTWSPIGTPDSLNETYLREYYKPAFETDSGLNGYVGSILGTNYSTLGNIGYNVYLKTNSGLELLGFTTNPSFTVNNKKGNLTFVVKSAYSSFKANMSDGKSVSIIVNSTSNNDDDDGDDDDTSVDPDDGDNSNNTNTNNRP